MLYVSGCLYFFVSRADILPLSDKIWYELILVRRVSPRLSFHSFFTLSCGARSFVESGVSDILFSIFFFFNVWFVSLFYR